MGGSGVFRELRRFKGFKVSAGPEFLVGLRRSGGSVGSEGSDCSERSRGSGFLDFQWI